MINEVAHILKIMNIIDLLGNPYLRLYDYRKECLVPNFGVWSNGM